MRRPPPEREVKTVRKDPLQIRLSGRGGQGVILSGVLVAEAAMRDGMQVVQTQSYGPEARLGAAKAEVVLSSRPIAFPEVVEPDILLCLSRDAYTRHGQVLAAGGLRLVDDRVAAEVEVRDALLLPLVATANEIDAPIAANVVALGALAQLTEMVSVESLRAAIRKRIKPAFLEVNERAFDAGLQLGGIRYSVVDDR